MHFTCLFLIYPTLVVVELFSRQIAKDTMHMYTQILKELKI